MSASPTPEEWKPPANPNPADILEEASADREAERYEAALAKHVWFHEHALEHDESVYGVRLSFALHFWAELGKVYPPARKKLEEIRDETERRFLSHPLAYGAFCELLSIHRTLKQESRTRETFEAVEATDAEAARELYPLAQPALVKTEAYKTCGRYIDGPRDFEQARSSFERAVTLSTDPRFGRSMLSYGKNEFRDGVTTLVALLVLNERKEEAEVVASAARGVWDNTAFSMQLDRALRGKVPPSR